MAAKNNRHGGQKMTHYGFDVACMDWAQSACEGHSGAKVWVLERFVELGICGWIYLVAHGVGRGGG